MNSYRRLARSKVGSKNWYKIKKKLASVYQKLKNARKFYLHSISKEIVEENDSKITLTDYKEGKCIILENAKNPYI